MSHIVMTKPVDAEAELDRLATLYSAAGGPVIRLLNLAGGRAETLIDRLPEPVKDALLDSAEQALTLAMRAATTSRAILPDQKPWAKSATVATLGAVGGFGGAPTALAELPVTTTLLLRAIQDAAKREGFDPRSDSVTFDCVRVLSAAGPLADDDGADLGFFSLRMTLTGPALHKLLATVAPRFAQVMGQKLAAQSVPVLGALAGATTNYAYAGYYQKIAEVHFGIRRLAIDADIEHEELVGDLRRRVRLLAH